MVGRLWENLVPLEGLRQMSHAVAETLATARHLFG
jgi:hypothetical protein